METFPVHQLVDNGFMFVPINPVMVDTANVAWRWFIEEEKDSKEGFAITRRGEQEPDLGHIIRTGENGGDRKHFFHLAHDMCFYMNAYEKQRFRCYEREYLLLDTFRSYLNSIALGVVKALDVEFGHIFERSLEEDVRRSMLFSRQYATTTLRSLWYPPEPDQRGAAIHIDRSLLTIHVGDRGGKLLAYSNDLGSDPVVITPPVGMAVMFFGVKALYLSRGAVSPLWHGSLTELGQERYAMVQFVQTDIGFDVSNARDALDAFYAKVD